MSQIQYQALSEPLVPNQPSDAVATDSWQPVFPSSIKRFAIAAAAATIIVAPISPIPTGVFESGGSFVSTGAYDLWQYQAITGPLDVPVEVNIDVEAWRPSYPASVSRTQIRAGAHQVHVSDTVAAAPTPPPVPDFSSSYNLPTGLPRPVVQTYRAQTFAIDTQWTRPPDAADLAQWRPCYPPTQRPIIYPRACYTWAQPHYAVVIQVPVMSWTGLYLDLPVLPPRNVATRTTVVSPLYLADITVLAPAGSWNGRYPSEVRARAWSLAGITAKSVEPVYIADLTVTAPTFSAQGIYPNQIAAKAGLGARQQRTFSSDAKWLAPTVVPAPDLAVPVFPDQVYAKQVPPEAPKYFAAEYILDVTLPAPELSWGPAYPDQAIVALRAPHLLNGWENDAFVIGVVEVLPQPPGPATLVGSTSLIGTSLTTNTLVGTRDATTALVGTTSSLGGFNPDSLYFTGTVG